MTDNTPVAYKYDIQSAQNFGSNIQKTLADNNARYLEVAKTGEFSDDIMKPLMTLKQEVLSMPNVANRSFLERLRSTTLVRKIEESKTKVTSVQSLLVAVGNEANKNIQNLERNIKDTSDFLDNSAGYIDQTEEYLKTIDTKIAEVKADGNPDKIAKDFYLKILESRKDELSSSIIMVHQQRQQINELRGASLVSSQKLRATVSIALPLLSSQLSQTLMVMNLERSNRTIDVISNSLTELSIANTKKWSEAMKRTAEQQNEGIVDIKALEENRQTIIETTQRVIEIQQTKDPERRKAIEENLRISLLEYRSKENIGSGNLINNSQQLDQLETLQGMKVGDTTL